MRSALSGIPLLITLEDGKVYVGNAIRLPNPELDRQDVRILPLLGGYRDKDTKKLTLTTDYHSVTQSLGEDGRLNHLRRGDFEIVLPVG